MTIDQVVLSCTMATAFGCTRCTIRLMCSTLTVSKTELREKLFRQYRETPTRVNSISDDDIQATLE